MNLFYKFWTDAKAGRNGFVPYEVHWSQVPGRDQAWYEETIKTIGVQKFEQEYNCAFLGSTNTLISGEKLACSTYKNPIDRIHEMNIYEYPVKDFIDEEGKQILEDHLYAMCVDVSEGKNMDYSAFSVFDISIVPYKQVATYRNNKISPMLFPTVLKMCGEYYNNAYILIELNNNPNVADVLANELEYENVMKVVSGNKKAQTLCAGFGKGMAFGLKMTPLVKRNACSNLKTLIESDKLLINDFETYSELTTFVTNGPSFEAEEGCNDDLAMSLVIFAWLATQKYFKEIVDHDLRKQLQLEQFNVIQDEDMLPTGEKSTGIEIPFFISDGDLWIESFDKYTYGEFINQLLDK